jgi:quercetin dioxygenase-like cupin family protein
VPFHRLDDAVPRELVPGFRVRFAHGSTMTAAHWEIDAGSVLPEHVHPHEQISQVVQGRFEIVVGGERRVLEPGLVAVIPGGVPHAGRALTDCRIIDVFHPVREDYR